MSTINTLLFFHFLNNQAEDEGGTGVPIVMIAALSVIAVFTVIAVSLVGILVVLLKKRRSTVNKDEPQKVTIGMLYIQSIVKFTTVVLPYHSLLLCTANKSGDI